MSKVVTVTCNFCGSGDYKEYDSEGQWHIVKCSSCGFIYTNPQPHPSTLHEYYSEDYFKDERHRSSFYNEDGSIRENEPIYINRIEDVESFITERGRILEIGSARGAFLLALKNRGWIVNGVEISADAAQIANGKHLETFNGVYTDYQPIEKFKVICMYQTLEHVPDPKEILTKAYEDLLEEGVLIVEVPNIECVEMKYSSNRKHLSYDLPRHLNHFSPDFLSEELEKIGFTIVDINYYPPKFILKLISLKSKFEKKKTPRVQKEEGTSNPAQVSSNEIPLLQKNNSRKNRILNRISKLFPGWRFTIIVRK